MDIWSGCVGILQHCEEPGLVDARLVHVRQDKTNIQRKEILRAGVH